MNVDSSRSHAMLSITVEAASQDGAITSGSLHIVDLAGSERQSKVRAGPLPATRQGGVRRTAPAWQLHALHCIDASTA